MGRPKGSKNKRQKDPITGRLIGSRMACAVPGCYYPAVGKISPRSTQKFCAYHLRYILNSLPKTFKFSKK